VIDHYQQDMLLPRMTSYLVSRLFRLLTLTLRRVGYLLESHELIQHAPQRPYVAFAIVRLIFADFRAHCTCRFMSRTYYVCMYVCLCLDACTYENALFDPVKILPWIRILRSLLCELVHVPQS
jgi:hypothetical protein